MNVTSSRRLAGQPATVMSGRLALTAMEATEGVVTITWSEMTLNGDTVGRH